MKILVGNTGLIGTTISEYEKFDLYFNSKNIHTFVNLVKNGDELFLSCLPAEKWLVNKNIQQDINNINNIINILSIYSYSKIILISTIDVYSQSPLGSNEDTKPLIKELNYGNNRYLFELLVRDILKYEQLKIFRLPALFNRHIKKNILYDLINDNNVSQINYNSTFQWYNLNMLSNDMKYYTKKYPNENIFNLFTEPIPSMDIISLFPNLIDQVNFGNKIEYNYTTKFGTYISCKLNTLNQIKKLINDLIVK